VKSRRAVRPALAVAGVLLAASVPPVGADGPTREEIAARIRELSERVVANPLEGLAAVGPDRLVNLDLLAWVRELTARVEALTALPVPDRVYDLRVVVPETPLPDQPDAVLALEPASNRPVLVLHLRNYEVAGRIEGRRALLQALFAIYLADAAGSGSPVAPPSWLTEGLLRNLDPADRAADMDAVLEAWQHGRLGPVESLLRGAPAILHVPDAAVPALVPAWQGAVVNWLSSAPGRRDRFAGLFDRLAGGEALTSDWLAGTLRGGAGSGLDEQWDRWLLRQRHAVHRVGDWSPRLLRQLNAELLLYPGTHGIPLDVPFGPATPVDAVPAFRTAEWMPAYARRTIVRLERLGAGRDARFQDVVEAWCDLFRAVMAGEDAAALQDRIRVARARELALEQAQADGMAERDDG